MYGRGKGGAGEGRGWRRERSTYPWGHHWAGGGGCWRHAGLAGAYTTWHTLAWLHVGSIIKGHQSAQAGREGLPCRAVAAAAALRLWLAWQPPAQGGRQVPHRVLHEELLGDRSDLCIRALRSRSAEQRPLGPRVHTSRDSELQNGRHQCWCSCICSA